MVDPSLGDVFLINHCRCVLATSILRLVDDETDWRLTVSWVHYLNVSWTENWDVDFAAQCRLIVPEDRRVAIVG